LRTIAGAEGTRLSLRPLIFREGETRLQILGRVAPREVLVCLTRHAPRRRGIQYAAASRFKRRRLWNTGSPGQAGRRQRGKCLRQEASSGL